MCETPSRGVDYGRLVERDRRPGAELPGALRRDGAGGDRPPARPLGGRGRVGPVDARAGGQAAHRTRRAVTARRRPPAVAVTAARLAACAAWYTLEPRGLVVQPG